MGRALCGLLLALVAATGSACESTESVAVAPADSDTPPVPVAPAPPPAPEPDRRPVEGPPPGSGTFLLAASDAELFGTQGPFVPLIHVVPFGDFSSDVYLSVSSEPAFPGALVFSSPEADASSPSTLVVAPNCGTPAGVYHLAVTGHSGATTKTVHLRLTLLPPYDGEPPPQPDPPVPDPTQPPIPFPPVPEREVDASLSL